MRCTVLMENKSEGTLACEHGLSLWIENRDHKFLLDTGATDAFLQNADALGIDLNEAEAAILSHAHFDHSGGFRGFFQRNSHAEVYLQETAKEACYSIYHDKKRYLGIPEGVLKEYPKRFRYSSGEVHLADGVWLLPHSSQGLWKRGEKAHMFRQTKEGLMVDDFQHEQSLVIRTDRGLTVFNSCSHGGIDVIVEEVRRRFPDEKVYAVAGGFHLMTSKGIHTLAYAPEEVEALGNRLKELGVEQIYTGHCTGEPAFQILKEQWGGRVHYLMAGTVFGWE